MTPLGQTVAIIALAWAAIVGAAVCGYLLGRADERGAPPPPPPPPLPDPRPPEWSMWSHAPRSSKGRGR
ncbi:MAG: hypothetical protein SFW67_35610 [Myxococcaceae bacterium]|nr:hypothetical protein [Myxococcaceae bacterium]